jgi:hypothetical protein
VPLPVDPVEVPAVDDPGPFSMAVMTTPIAKIEVEKSMKKIRVATTSPALMGDFGSLKKS